MKQLAPGANLSMLDGPHPRSSFLICVHLRSS
jgi:hypothetical protein